MKRKYRFIGMEACLHGYNTRLLSFGQPIEMEQAHADDAILGGGVATGYAGACALIPEADFLAIFTPEEVRQYEQPASHMTASAAFLEKKKKALMRIHEIRVAMEQPAKQEQPPAVPAAVPQTTPAAPDKE